MSYHLEAEVSVNSLSEFHNAAMYNPPDKWKKIRDLLSLFQSSNRTKVRPEYLRESTTI